MDLLQLIRHAWRITWQCWILWLLSLLMFLAMTPAAVLAGAFGGVAGLMAVSGPSRPGLQALYQLPFWSWLVIVLVMWVTLVITTALTWILQVAAVRGAALAADQALPGGSAPTLRTALAIGRQRLRSLVKLSLTFGVLMMALPLLPPLAAILFSVASRGQTDTLGLLQFTQTSMVPVNAALGVALFLLMMAIAVEDLTPLKAVRRTWGVLRYGWWGFLLVFGLSALPSAAIIVLLLPLGLTLPLAFLFPNGWLVPVLGGLVVVPLLLFILLFTAVFTTTMYTLVYRAAAQLTQPGPDATPSPV
jgi:hypothetical protein